MEYMDMEGMQQQGGVEPPIARMMSYWDWLPVELQAKIVDIRNQEHRRALGRAGVVRNLLRQYRMARSDDGCAPVAFGRQHARMGTTHPYRAGYGELERFAVYRLLATPEGADMERRTRRFWEGCCGKDDHGGSWFVQRRELAFANPADYGSYVCTECDEEWFAFDDDVKPEDCKSHASHALEGQWLAWVAELEEEDEWREEWENDLEDSCWEVFDAWDPECWDLEHHDWRVRRVARLALPYVVPVVIERDRETRGLDHGQPVWVVSRMPVTLTLRRESREHRRAMRRVEERAFEFERY